MSPGQYETRVCGYVLFGFIDRALLRTLMRPKYVFVCSPQAFWLSSQQLVFWAF